MIREPIGKWFVWTRTGRPPHHPHDTYEAAATEAKRLATEHPGKKFIVLHMTDKFHEPVTVEARVIHDFTEPVEADPLREMADL